MSTLLPITEVARKLGLEPQHLVPYGYDKAKVRPEAWATDRPPGKLILVSAINPTPAGEGKTTTSIGLAQGLARLGKSVCVALREPSLGPTFGMKGGATGGGASTVQPSVDINLHFTGDFHAITTANNLLAALIDNHVFHGNKLRIDPRRILWRRAVDLNDRSLRDVVIGLGGHLQGVPRETGFDITPASEIMAALCLANDAEDLRARLGRLLVALTYDREAVTAADLNAVGALMVVLKDALMPNLVQTCEGVPALVHGGPFGNIAHGCSSVIGTKLALAHADWTVTEAGFGFELGAEKFLDIKCVSAGLRTACVVLVATVRALKFHGGVPFARLGTPDPAAVERGLGNLRKHVENIRAFGECPVVALNRFGSDSAEEVEVVHRACAMFAPFAVSEVFEKGGEGGVELARAVIERVENCKGRFHPLYERSDPFRVKLEKVARLMYGAASVEYSRDAERDLRLLERLGYADLPICVAKTEKSLSDDPTRLGRPEDFKVVVRGVLVSAGAGFLVPLMGEIMRMPGLPASPAAERIDLRDGRVVGMG
jgi:formate--tetrahydrofolate ligase